MKILVCISHVPDTTTKVKFVEQKEFDKTDVQWILNPWDELSLTRALELKESSKGQIKEITVINVGGKETDQTLRKALAIGADKAIRVDFEAKDAFSVAEQIASVAKDRAYDLILTGIESSDYNGSAVGGILSELLDIQSVTAVSGIDFADNAFDVKREIDGGYEKLNLPTPFVAVVQKGIAIDPRIANMRGIMMAKRKPLEVVSPAAGTPVAEVISYEMPKPKPPVKILENAEQLVDKLYNEAKVL